MQKITIILTLLLLLGAGCSEIKEQPSVTKVKDANQETQSITMETNKITHLDDQKNLAAAESDFSSLEQEDVMFNEIDQTSDDISGSSEAALDEKSLNEEALSADISGDISALDGGALQDEVDQSIDNIVQY